MVFRVRGQTRLSPEEIESKQKAINEIKIQLLQSLREEQVRTITAPQQVEEETKGSVAF